MVIKPEQQTLTDRIHEFYISFDPKTNSFDVRQQNAKTYVSFFNELHDIILQSMKKEEINTIESHLVKGGINIDDFGEVFVVPVYTFPDLKKPEKQKNKDKRDPPRYYLFHMQKNPRTGKVILSPLKATIFQKNAETDRYFSPRTSIIDYLVSRYLNPSSFDNPFSLTFNGRENSKQFYYNNDKINEMANLVLLEQDNRIKANLLVKPDITFLSQNISLPPSMAFVEIDAVSKKMAPHIYNFKDNSLVPCMACDSVLDKKVVIQSPYRTVPFSDDPNHNENPKPNIMLFGEFPFLSVVYKLS